MKSVKSWKTKKKFKIKRNENNSSSKFSKWCRKCSILILQNNTSKTNKKCLSSRKYLKTLSELRKSSSNLQRKARNKQSLLRNLCLSLPKKQTLLDTWKQYYNLLATNISDKIIQKVENVSKMLGRKPNVLEIQDANIYFKKQTKINHRVKQKAKLGKRSYRAYSSNNIEKYATDCANAILKFFDTSVPSKISFKHYCISRRIMYNFFDNDIQPTLCKSLLNDLVTPSIFNDSLINYSEKIAVWIDKTINELDWSLEKYNDEISFKGMNHLNEETQDINNIEINKESKEKSKKSFLSDLSIKYIFHGNSKCYYGESCKLQDDTLSEKTYTNNDKSNKNDNDKIHEEFFKDIERYDRSTDKNHDDKRNEDLPEKVVGVEESMKRKVDNQVHEGYTKYTNQYKEESANKQMPNEIVVTEKLPSKTHDGTPRKVTFQYDKDFFSGGFCEEDCAKSERNDERNRSFDYKVYEQYSNDENRYKNKLPKKDNRQMSDEIVEYKKISSKTMHDEIYLQVSCQYDKENICHKGCSEDDYVESESADEENTVRRFDDKVHDEYSKDENRYTNKLTNNQDDRQIPNERVVYEKISSNTKHDEIFLQLACRYGKENIFCERYDEEDHVENESANKKSIVRRFDEVHEEYSKDENRYKNISANNQEDRQTSDEREVYKKMPNTVRDKKALNLTLQTNTDDFYCEGCREEDYVENYSFDKYDLYCKILFARFSPESRDKIHNGSKQNLSPKSEHMKKLKYNSYQRNCKDICEKQFGWSSESSLDSYFSTWLKSEKGERWLRKKGDEQWHVRNEEESSDESCYSLEEACYSREDSFYSRKKLYGESLEQNKTEERDEINENKLPIQLYQQEQEKKGKRSNDKCDSSYDIKRGEGMSYSKHESFSNRREKPGRLFSASFNKIRQMSSVEGSASGIKKSRSNEIIRNLISDIMNKENVNKEKEYPLEDYQMNELGREEMNKERTSSKRTKLTEKDQNDQIYIPKLNEIYIEKINTVSRCGHNGDRSGKGKGEIEKETIPLSGKDLNYLLDKPIIDNEIPNSSGKDYILERDEMKRGTISTAIEDRTSQTEKLSENEMETKKMNSTKRDRYVHIAESIEDDMGGTGIKTFIINKDFCESYESFKICFDDLDEVVGTEQNSEDNNTEEMEDNSSSDQDESFKSCVDICGQMCNKKSPRKKKRIKRRVLLKIKLKTFNRIGLKRPQNKCESRMFDQNEVFQNDHYNYNNIAEEIVKLTKYGIQRKYPIKKNGRKYSKQKCIRTHDFDAICCLTLKLLASWLLEVSQNCHKWFNWITCIIQKMRYYASILKGKIKNDDGTRRILYKEEWEEFCLCLDEDIKKYNDYSAKIQNLGKSIIDKYHKKNIKCCELCLQKKLIRNSHQGQEVVNKFCRLIKKSDYWFNWMTKLVRQATQILAIYSCKMNISYLFSNRIFKHIYIILQVIYLQVPIHLFTRL